MNDGIRFELERLPETRVDKGSRVTGIFMMVFALFWGGLPTIALVRALSSETFEPGSLFLLLFTVIGTGLFLAGIQMMTSHTETTITPDQVTVRKRSVFRRGEWTTPLTQYQGVLSRSEYHSGGKNRSSYTLYIVELLHPERARTVRVFQSRTDAGFRATWERASRTLGLPALTRGEGGEIQVRDVADLDRPVRELVREGRIAVSFDAAHPPAGLAMRADGDTLEVTVVRKQKGAWGVLLFLLLPASFIYIGFFVKQAPMIFGFIGLLFAGVLIFSFVWMRVARQQLRLSRSQVSVRYDTPWGIMAAKELKAATVEMVRVGTPKAGGSSPEVLVESDQGTITFGAGLSPEEREWVKNLILHVLAS